MTTSRTHRTMKIIETPASNDVLCGKDKTFNRNIGNMTYRQLIVSTALQYSKIKTKPEKMKITSQIVHTMIHIHHSRFLKQVMIHNDSADGSSCDNEYYWQEISITAARDKTSHALRFCAAQMQLAQPKSINNNNNYRFTYLNCDENYKPTAADTTIPVTPTTPIRRSIRGRVQRKAKRYSPTTSVATVPMTAAAKRKILNVQQPIQRKHHRRTVSSENSNHSYISQPVLSPMIVGSSSSMYPPSPHHSENTIPYYQNDYDQYQNYYNYYNHHPYDPYTTTAHHRTNHDETPVPMECSSSTTFVPVLLDASHSSSMTVRRRRSDQYDTRMYLEYNNTSSRKLGQNSKEDDGNDDEQEDDLDAILREPIHWEEDVIDDDGDKRNVV
jgi:hypothetical protein